jgi:hypothetical protein
MKRLVLAVNIMIIIVFSVCVKSSFSPVNFNTVKIHHWIDQKIDRHWVHKQPAQKIYPLIDPNNSLSRESSHAILLIEEGKTLFLSGQVVLAVEALQQAFIGFSQIGDRLNQSRSLSDLAMAHVNRTYGWILQRFSGECHIAFRAWFQGRFA